MPKGHRLAEWRSACLWIPGLTGLGGTTEQNVCVLVSSLAGLRGTALQSEYYAVLCWLWGCGQKSRDHAGLGIMAQWDRAPVGLCRPGGHGLALIANVCGSLVLRAHRMEILQVWRLGVWGSTTLVGQKSRGGGSEIPWCTWAYGAGLGMQCLLFFWYMVWWRGLQGAKGSECWCFSSPWCFTSFKQVSSFLSKSLDHGGQKVCGCSLVAILDLKKQPKIWMWLICSLYGSKYSNLKLA
jgi:hypothetical protein